MTGVLSYSTLRLAACMITVELNGTEAAVIVASARDL